MDDAGSDAGRRELRELTQQLQTQDTFVPCSASIDVPDSEPNVRDANELRHDSPSSCAPMPNGSYGAMDESGSGL